MSARRLKIYLEPRDVWVGWYRGENHHYVCLLPCVVIRWPRRQVDPTCCFTCRAKVTDKLDLLESLAVPFSFAPCACGNKRCPRSNDHRNACTGSNESGQPGSAWEHVT